MTEEQKASLQYAAEWLFRSEDISNRKHAERLRALLAAGASEGQEPVAIYHGNGIIDCGDAGHHNIELLKMIPAGAKLFKDPSGEIAVLREAMKGAEVIANAAGAEIAALRERIAKYQAVCAAAYQFVGAVDGPVRFLDALSNAANGEPASVEDSLALLPAEPSERIAGMEKDAEDAARYLWLEGQAKCDPKMGGNHHWWGINLRGVHGPTLAIGIDAAIAKEPK